MKKKLKNVTILDIPKDFKGVIDKRKKEEPVIQFYRWVLKQAGKTESELKKVHVSEVMVNQKTGKALYEIQRKSIEKELGKIYVERKVQSETAMFWLCYGPNESMEEGEDFKVYLTKDWFK